MVRPIDMQLTMWKVEQQAQQDRDPPSAAAQAVRQDGFKREIEARDRQVQAGNESGAENRVKPKKEEEERKRGKGGKKTAGNVSEPEEKEEKPTPPKQGGCDFYA